MTLSIPNRKDRLRKVRTIQEDSTASRAKLDDTEDESEVALHSYIRPILVA